LSQLSLCVFALAETNGGASAEKRKQTARRFFRHHTFFLRVCTRQDVASLLSAAPRDIVDGAALDIELFASSPQDRLLLLPTSSTDRSHREPSPFLSSISLSSTPFLARSHCDPAWIHIFAAVDTSNIIRFFIRQAALIFASFTL
jgi:hypothetical protein